MSNVRVTIPEIGAVDDDQPNVELVIETVVASTFDEFEIEYEGPISATVLAEVEA